ncbi:hypothetical protein [Arthrobacter sp. ZGTC412]|uniref:hypothetical protein n=1 Tax=Arthrobacter sp. ZGTC412 TaxID=2058900 RepID=UPI0011AFD8DE|nr:hypothetical protein [Arthrobacter sp. ZGTC412]
MNSIAGPPAGGNMPHPAKKKLSKKRSLGVHIKMNTENFSRKMLSIAVNHRDGGVMVTPHLQNWGDIVTSELTVPASGGLVPDEAGYVITGPDNKPKLHYHRSGMSSVQPQKFMGGEGRKTIHLPSLDELDGVQIFSVAARVPAKLPWDQKVNKGDIFNIMDLAGVRTLLLSAVIYDRNKIPAGSVGGMDAIDPVSFASNHNNAVLVDLSGYGLEAVLVLHFRPMPETLPDFAADFSLVSFHQDRLTTDGGVAIHDGPGIPYAALLHPIPAVHEFHQTSALDPVISTIENRPPPPGNA